MSDSHYAALQLNAKKYSQKISPICHCICSIITLFGLLLIAAGFLIGSYNRRMDHLEGFTSEINYGFNNL